MIWRKREMTSDRLGLSWKQMVEYSKVKQWGRDFNLKRRCPHDLSAQDLINEMGVKSNGIR